MSFLSHRVLTLNLRNNSLEYLFAFFVHFVLDLWLFMTMSNGLTKLRLNRKKKKGGGEQMWNAIHSFHTYLPIMLLLGRTICFQNQLFIFEFV
jgi:hypothetical protein